MCGSSNLKKQEAKLNDSQFDDTENSNLVNSKQIHNYVLRQVTVYRCIDGQRRLRNVNERTPSPGYSV